MRRLAIDTSSTACTAALQFDEQLFERHEEQPREHTRLLMPMIHELLQEASVTTAELDCIVLGNGPGSFIGMRIAASVAQGLAFASGISIRPVSSLAAVAAEAFVRSDARTVAVAQDAHMSEVYLGMFSRGENDLPVAVSSERLYGGGVIDELREHGSASVVAVGSGWSRYPEILAESKDSLTLDSSIQFPRARFLLALSAHASAIKPALVEPAYIRQKVAEKPRQLTS